MSVDERQKQFRAEIERLPGVRPEPQVRIAENFGFSNSARVIEGGLFACNHNAETYSRKLLAGIMESSQFVLLCVLTFPPQDEVYFAIIIDKDAGVVNTGLLKLARVVEARNAALEKGKTPSRINNNVKFYVTSGGNIYFGNEFRDAVIEPELDPDCLAKIGSIEFSIWPPDVSARRSLLAREFVGYLGRLIGNEKIHEITVWPDASALGPLMRRMPQSIVLADIEVAVSALGGWYSGDEVRSYHAALNFLRTKHFVILSGLSGTGKTLLARLYARAVHGVTTPDGPDPLLFVCPVRPEWIDPTGLTGYYDQLSDRYVVPRFLEAVLVATAHRDSPVFVVLDEMNLAKVEHYFSDVLSCMETGEDLQLHAHGVPKEGTTGTSIPAAIRLPSNLYISGTINVDETTNLVSNKVLDRAVVIDMSQVGLGGFLADLAKRSPDLAAARAAVEPVLLATQALLVQHGLGFGYRVAEEVVRYHAFAALHLAMKQADVSDELMVQKVLVKLRGAGRERSLLTGLQKILTDMPKAQGRLSQLLADLDEFGSFQATR